jgi:hypothetical protein
VNAPEPHQEAGRFAGMTPIGNLVGTELARTVAMEYAQRDEPKLRVLGETFLTVEAELRALRDLRLEPLDRVYRAAAEHVRFCDDESFATLSDAVADAAGTVPPERR